MEPTDSLVTQFRTYLKWHKCRLNVLAFLVLGLLEKQTVNFTSLAISDRSGMQNTGYSAHEMFGKAVEKSWRPRDSNAEVIIPERLVR